MRETKSGGLAWIRAFVQSWPFGKPRPFMGGEQWHGKTTSL
jgi:hypothetical protein